MNEPISPEVYYQAVQTINGFKETLNNNINDSFLKLKNEQDIDTKIKILTEQRGIFTIIQKIIEEEVQIIRDYKTNQQFGWLGRLSTLFRTISVKLSSWSRFGLLNKANKELETIQNHITTLTNEVTTTLAKANDAATRESSAAENAKTFDKKAKTAENKISTEIQSEKLTTKYSIKIFSGTDKCTPIAKRAMAAKIEAAKTAEEIAILNKNFTTRIIRAEDYIDREAAIKAVTDIAKESGSVIDSETYLSEQYKKGSTYFSGSNIETLFAVNDKNEIVGFSIIVTKGEECHLERLAVRKDYINTQEKIGTRLYFDTLQYAKLNGYEKVELTFDPTIYKTSSEEMKINVVRRTHFYTRMEKKFNIFTEYSSSIYDDVNVAYKVNTFFHNKVLKKLVQSLKT